MDDSLHKRGKNLEDAFFRDVDDVLMQKLRDGLQETEDVANLAAVTGINDHTVLKKLAAQNIRPELLICLGLIPLVAVAWADGVVQPSERDAILKAAHDNGIESGSPGGKLLDSWLKTKPGHEVVEAWKGYVGALKATIDTTAFNQTKTSVMQRAHKIATAAGGLLGMNTISASEQKVIDELQKAFD